MFFGPLILTVAEVLQGGRDMECSSPSKRAAAAGSDNGRSQLRDGVGVDGQREYQRVYQG